MAKRPPLPHRVSVPVLLPKPRIPGRITPPSRAIIVNSLLTNPKTAAIIRALPNPNRVPSEKLATTSLDGKPVKGGVSIPMRPTSGQMVSDFDWESGIQFTPKSPGPTYTYQGKTYNIGTFDAHNLYLPQETTLSDLYNQDVLYLNPWGVLSNLYLELPPDTSAYMITVQLTGLTQTLVDKIRLCVSDATGFGEVLYALLSDGRGIVGIYTIHPYTPPRDPTPRSKMRKVSCSIHLCSSLEAPQPWSGGGPESFMEWFTSSLEAYSALSEAISEPCTFGGFVITRL